MNSEPNKKLQNNYNWKGVMDYIKEEGNIKI